MFQSAPDIAGLLVGGGGLPAGFVGNLVDMARAAGVPTAFAGIDVPLRLSAERPLRPEAVRDYLARFDYVGVRSKAATEALLRTGATVQHAGDWALVLQADRAADLTASPRRIALVLRESALEETQWGYLEAVERLLEGLRARGHEPFWLPFCPEDERFLGEVALSTAAPLERCWWNPRRMKQILEIGRAHV